MNSGSRGWRLALLASAASLSACPAIAADILVGGGMTDTAQKPVGDTDTVTVEQGGVLSVADTAIKWNAASTDLQIINDGTIESTAAGGRAINAGGSATAPRTITLTNGATGIIRSENDAFRINVDITDGSTVHVVNSGTILSTVDGQAIDFDGVASTADGQIQIDNLAGGVIQSSDADALRPGEGAVINNAGLIYAGNGVNLSSDGVDLQGHRATVNNLAGGVISGARHGITTDVDVTVVNYGTIVGRNGSGVGSDGDANVLNYGTITGAYDGSGVGDGDGVDIDGGGRVENYGTIEALGAAGVKSDGRGNGSDGITFGLPGGVVINHEGALIYSVSAGIAVGGPTVVLNDGVIQADGAINQYADEVLSVTNTGSIIGNIRGIISYGADDEIINSGLISGGGIFAIQTGAGNDRLTLLPGPRSSASSTEGMGLIS